MSSVPDWENGEIFAKLTFLSFATEPSSAQLADSCILQHKPDFQSFSVLWKAWLCFVILIRYLKNILNLSSKEPGKNCFYQAVHKLFDVVSVSLGFRIYMIYLYTFGIRGECKCVGHRTILQRNYLATGIKTIPMEKKCKMVVWGGLTKSCEKKRSEKQRRKGKIFLFECRVPKNSQER